jgi:hypothetical protein
MEHDGRFINTWETRSLPGGPAQKQMQKKAINSLIESRKILNINNNVFTNNYDIVPEYKAGMHMGTVTCRAGGYIKKRTGDEWKHY